MPIIVNLDVMMAKRKMSLNELSEKVELTLSNLSILKTGKAKAIRFSTLEAIKSIEDKHIVCEKLNWKVTIDIDKTAALYKDENNNIQVPIKHIVMISSN